MIFSKIKVWLFSALGLFVAGLMAAVKIFSAKARREKKRADQAEAGLEKSIEVLQRDTELDSEFKSRRAEEAKKIESDGDSDELSKPNEWVKDNRNFD